MALVSVVGASGRQGLSQVRELLKAGHDVRAISRQPDPFHGEGFNSVEVRPADLFDEATLTPAFEGSDYIFFNHPVNARRERAQLAANVGHAGKAVGVKRVVWNTSSWIPDRAGDSFTYADNIAAINALWRTGVPGTVFGAVLFMDNLLTDFARPWIVDKGIFLYPHTEQMRANWISLDDVARIMIHSLDRPDLEGSWLNIGGPEALGPQDVARALSKALSRDIRFQHSPPDEFGRNMIGAIADSIGDPARVEAMSKDIADFYRYNTTAPTKPFEVNMTLMRNRIPLELETLEEWARRQDWSDSANRPSGG